MLWETKLVNQWVDVSNPLCSGTRLLKIPFLFSQSLHCIFTAYQQDRDPVLSKVLCDYGKFSNVFSSPVPLAMNCQDHWAKCLLLFSSVCCEQHHHLWHSPIQSEATVSSPVPESIMQLPIYTPLQEILNVSQGSLWPFQPFQAFLVQLKCCMRQEVHLLRALPFFLVPPQASVFCLKHFFFQINCWESPCSCKALFRSVWISEGDGAWVQVIIAFSTDIFFKENF